MKYSLFNLKNWVQRYERQLSSLALLGGFITDALTLRRVDLPAENIILISYFVLIVAGIFLLNIAEVRAYNGRFSRHISYLIPLVIQFAFGGLFSGFTIFYFRSGSLAASWPFICILFGFLIGNELLRRHYARLVFQVSALFTAFFFFTIFFIPIIVAHMGAWIFIVSGGIALLFILAFVYILFLYMPQRVQENKKALVYSIFSIYALINILYFLNLIPPIPLLLKQAGVYHDVTVQNNTYVVQEEKHSRWSWIQIFQDVHLVEGDPVYVFSSVFAPTDISIEIVHNWRYFDTTAQRWISVSRIPYTIAGGSDRGYRGYSVKEYLAEGDWAVDVETARGQVLGRILFSIEYVDEKPVLTQKTL